MAKLKPKWVKTDIPKDIKVKLWRIMKDNPTYESWQKGIARARYEFDTEEDKYIPLSRDTYRALQDEIKDMPPEEVTSLPPELQSWVKQLRPELESGKYKTKAAEMTSLPEKYLIDHYQKLHKVLEQFYDQFCTPELPDLSLFPLKDRITISRSYVSEVSIPTVTYEKGAVQLDIEVSDSFLWECFKEHLTAEFPEFSENLGDWKKGIATIVEECYGITKTIADQFAKMGWNSAEPYLDPGSEVYRPGVFYYILTDSMYKCLIAHHLPTFQRVSDSHSLLILVMDYSTGRAGIARGEGALLDQVQQHCVDIASNDALKKRVTKVLNVIRQLNSKQEPVREKMRVVLERGTLKGTCRICSDLVS